MCVSVVSLLPLARRRIDVDNVVKGLLDSLQGVLYDNDQRIQCLTSRRVDYNGPTGGYFIAARAVWPWDADVVVDDGAPPRFTTPRVRLPRPPFDPLGTRPTR